MPSHADRVRRHYKDADGQEESPVTQPLEALNHSFAELQRYAGWLGKDHASVAVRADVHALGAAMDAGHDTSLLLSTLGANIARLSGGDIQKMLRKSFGELSTVLWPSEIQDQKGGRHV
jgi:hypothetical protein